MFKAVFNHFTILNVDDRLLFWFVGFHEAIGDSIALSIMTPVHLQCRLKLDLGFPNICDKTKDKSKDTPITETEMNFLYLTALQKACKSQMDCSIWTKENAKYIKLAILFDYVGPFLAIFLRFGGMALEGI